MISQLRIYTINRDMMPSWSKLFNEVLVSIQEQYGMKIDSAWTNEANTEFVWVRSFDDADDIKEKEAAFYSSDEWKSVSDKARSHIAKSEVRVIHPALNTG